MSSSDPYDACLSEIASGHRRYLHNFERTHSSGDLIYRCNNEEQFSYKKFSHYKNLARAYHKLRVFGGSAPGPDNITYTDLSKSQANTMVRGCAKKLSERTYTKGGFRTVLIPREGREPRKLHLLDLGHRTVDKALDVAMRGFLTAQIPNINLDPRTMYRNLERLIRQHRWYTLAIDDIANCFPTIPLHAVYQSLSNHITNPELDWLIQRVIISCNENNVGLPQGSPSSPLCAEVYLHHYFDRRLQETAINQNPFSLLRYVDNVSFLCRNARETENLLSQANSVLRDQNQRLKGQGGGIIDIREQHNQVLLGLVPRWQDDRLVFQLPPDYLEKLETHLVETLNPPRPMERARLVLEGWIDSKGPAFSDSVSNNRIMNEVTGICHRIGFYQFERHVLVDKCRNAYARWRAFTRRNAA